MIFLQRNGFFHLRSRFLRRLALLPDKANKGRRKTCFLPSLSILFSRSPAAALASAVSQ